MFVWYNDLIGYYFSLSGLIIAWCLLVVFLNLLSNTAVSQSPPPSSTIHFNFHLLSAVNNSSTENFMMIVLYLLLNLIEIKSTVI